MAKAERFWAVVSRDRKVVVQTIDRPAIYCKEELARINWPGFKIARVEIKILPARSKDRKGVLVNSRREQPAKKGVGKTATDVEKS